MKKIIPVLVLLAVACNNRNSSTESKTNSDSTYTISGKIRGVESGYVYLYHIERDSNKTDSAKVENGSFQLKGKVTHPEFCLFGFDINGEKTYPLNLFVDNSNITITGSRDSTANAIVTGSPTQDELKSFNELMKPLETKNKELVRQYQIARMRNDSEKLDSIQKQGELLNTEFKKHVLQYAKDHPTSYIGIFEVAQGFSEEMDPSLVEPVFNVLDPKIQSSYFGKALKENLDVAKQTAIGTAAPNFTLNDTNGKPVSLNSFKGKYTLIDFWASWCGPCRMENPEVVKAYQAFKSKGFTILGVSLDEQKNKWEEAIAKDQLNWTHVSDLKGWQSDVAALYGVRAIPMNFLLDKDGKIIAKGLRGEELSRKLTELVK